MSYRVCPTGCFKKTITQLLLKHPVVYMSKVLEKSLSGAKFVSLVTLSFLDDSRFMAFSRLIYGLLSESLK